MHTNEDYWLTRQEVADRLKLPVKTLAQWASRGRGPRFRRIGKYTRYRMSELIEWENEQVSGGSSAA